MVIGNATWLFRKTPTKNDPSEKQTSMARASRGIKICVRTSVCRGQDTQAPLFQSGTVTRSRAETQPFSAFDEDLAPPPPPHLFFFSSSNTPGCALSGATHRLGNFSKVCMYEDGHSWGGFPRPGARHTVPVIVHEGSGRLAVLICRACACTRV